jgi:hypothetical protein
MNGGVEATPSAGHLWISVVRNQLCDLVLSGALLYCVVQHCSACVCVLRKDEGSYKPDACLISLHLHRLLRDTDVV